MQGLSLVAQVGATLHRSARASHHRGLSCCGAQAPDAQAQQLWLTGPVAPRHEGSSQTRAWTHVPCIGRQILNHCATREAQEPYFEIQTSRAPTSQFYGYEWWAPCFNLPKNYPPPLRYEKFVSCPDKANQLTGNHSNFHDKVRMSYMWQKVNYQSPLTGGLVINLENMDCVAPAWL